MGSLAETDIISSKTRESNPTIPTLEKVFSILRITEDRYSSREIFWLIKAYTSQRLLVEGDTERAQEIIDRLEVDGLSEKLDREFGDIARLVRPNGRRRV